MPKTSHGFTLIELLVALIVLSIGFAGYAALQIVGIQTVEDSYQRSQMTLLLEEMAERMRSNRIGSASYDGISYQEGVDDCQDLKANIIEAENCERDDWAVGDDTCVAQEMAQYDVARVFCGYEGPEKVWTGGIVSLSEAASVSIVADPVIAGSFRLTGSWTTSESDRDPDVDSDGDGDNTLLTQQVVMDLTP